MSRQEKREQERKMNKLKQWLGSFNADQKALWEQTVLSEIEKNDRTTCLILDACYMAAISSVADLELIDIERIVKESSTYIEDYKNKLGKGDAIAMTISQSSAIKSKIRSLIKTNKEKVQSIKELEKEYKIPFAELDVMWLQVKSKMGIVNKHASKKNAAEEEVEEILEETQEQADKKLREIIKKHLPKKELPFVVTPKEIEKNQKESNIGKLLANEVMKPIAPNNLISASRLADEVKRSGFEFKAPSNLEIINTTIEVRGKYATYKKDSQGLTDGNRIFKDIEDLNSYKGNVESDFDKYMEDLQEQLSNLNDEIITLEFNKNKSLNKVLEMEEVFNLCISSTANSLQR